MLYCTVRSISKYLQDANFYIISNDVAAETEIYHKLGLNIKIIEGKSGILINLIRLIKGLVVPVGIKNDPLLKIYKESDMVVFILADALSYDFTPFGSMLVKAASALDVAVSKKICKRTYLFPFSAGPFDNFIINSMIKYGISKADIKNVRELISKEILENIGVKNVLLRPDIAFNFPVVDSTRLNSLKKELEIGDNEEVIGFNISQLMRFKSNHYENQVIELIDWLIDNYKKRILLIPHEILANKSDAGGDIKLQGGDDIDAVNYIYSNSSHKEMLIPILKNYNAKEIKSIISLCEIFIGARMHSIIAALSLAIPCIAISYSVKAPGIMEMAGMDEYVINLNKMTTGELKNLVSRLWSNKDMIRNKLEGRKSYLRSSFEECGKEIKDILEKK